LAPVEVEPLMVDTLGRWGRTPRRWTLGAVDEATVLGDHDRLALALDALIENAVAHTDVDGRITVSARLEGATVVLAVADSGCGIPAADLGRIFDRFARVDLHRNREAGGVGLGLAIVKAVAEAHRGSVRVQSTVGSGSVFEMLVPTATGPPGPRPAGPVVGAYRSDSRPERSTTPAKRP